MVSANYRAMYALADGVCPLGRSRGFLLGLALHVAGHRSGWLIRGDLRARNPSIALLDYGGNTCT